MQKGRPCVSRETPRRPSSFEPISAASAGHCRHTPPHPDRQHPATKPRRPPPSPVGPPVRAAAFSVGSGTGTRRRARPATGARAGAFSRDRCGRVLDSAPDTAGRRSSRGAPTASRRPRPRPRRQTRRPPRADRNGDDRALLQHHVPSCHTLLRCCVPRRLIADASSVPLPGGQRRPSATIEPLPTAPPPHGSMTQLPLSR